MKIKLLKDLCFPDKCGIYGIPAIAEDFELNKTRYLRITDISEDGKLLNDSKKSVTSDDIEKYILEEGDIVFARTGNSTGKAYYHDSRNGRLAFAGFLIKFSINPELVNPKYLRYYTITNHYKQWVENFSLGSTRGNLNAQSFGECLIPLPNRKQQDFLAKVLSDLDAKIEVNNKINQELEAMAKTLYDYWFVQFDFPDANGEPYKSSGGKMFFNEELKRKIPEGWEVKTLLDIAKFTNGLACQKFRPKENEDSYRVIKIREMGSGFTDNSEFVSVNIPKKIIVNNGDVLFSWSATLDVKIWTGGKGALNQHIFIIKSKKYPRSYYYFELLNYLEHFKMQAALRKTTMGHITQEHLKQSRITIPPIDIINRIDKIIKPILNKKVTLDEQNQKLSELRDWLLPMLMNGQVRVGDKDELIESETELSFAAEPPTPYDNESLLSDLFPLQDLYSEVACMLAIEKEMHRKSRGKTWVQKTANHLKEIKEEPKLKNVVFEEYHWGMFSQTIAKAIDSNPFLTIDDVAGLKVYKVRFNKIAELNQWMQEPRNTDFVSATRSIVSLYDNPLINNDLDRIELLNTVYRCNQKLGTTDFESIYKAMREWPMQEQGYANKAEKFEPYVTKLMIGLVEKIIK